jgi:hypothetical protein
VTASILDPLGMSAAPTGARCSTPTTSCRTSRCRHAAGRERLGRRRRHVRRAVPLEPPRHLPSCARCRPSEAFACRSPPTTTRPGESLVFASYTIVLGCASAVRALMLWHAQRRGLLRQPLAGRDARFEFLRSILPTVVFLSSAGLVFLIGEWAVLFWISLRPLDGILARLQRRDSRAPRTGTAVP